MPEVTDFSADVPQDRLVLYGASGAAPSRELDRLQQSLPVKLIATPRAELKTCISTEQIREVVVRNHEKYDFYPVTDGGTDGNARIIGLLDLKQYQSGCDGVVTVAERMSPLSDDNLIGADASILDFIQDADQKPCRLLVSGLGIEGLVCLSDIQNLPVRVAFFALITHLEMVMADAIRRMYSDSGSWLVKLSEERRANIQHEINKAREEDRWIDDLLFTQFKDKVTILKKVPNFPCSKTAFENQMDTAKKLRDQIAHANGYVTARADAEKVCQTVRDIKSWINKLETLKNQAKRPGGA